MTAGAQLDLEDAVKRGDVDSVRVAIAAGADAAGTCHGVDQPIVALAAQAGDLAVLLELASAGADLDLADRTGRTLTASAASSGDGIESLTSLLCVGADPSIPDKHGYTPLHWAAAYGYAENALCLLRFGADHCVGVLT